MALILEIWKHKGQILEGILNNLFTSEDVKSVAIKRFNKCLECSHLDKKGKDCAIPGTKPCCKLCGCSLRIKTFSMSAECPAPEKYWTAIMTEDEEELLNNQLN